MSVFRCIVRGVPYRNVLGEQSRFFKQYGTTQSKDKSYDVAIVGGGIVGVATARELILRHPGLTFAILEKENQLAFHQSGHNSGVIHAGIYYTPGSLKAKLCVEGLNLSYKYCDEHNIPYKKVGKLIVAVDESEIPRLDALHERGIKNEVKDLQVVDAERIREIEPYCRGVKALWSPHTGIVDWGKVCRSYGENFTQRGGDIYLNFNVSGFSLEKESKTGEETGLKYPVRINSETGKSVRCRYVLTCGGLYSDHLAELSGCSSDPKIVPFRGEYLILKQSKCHMIRGNIYPVPNPQFPFLGVHFTPRMNGSVWLGPNAVLAFRREGYKFSDFNYKEFMDAVRYTGFHKLVGSYFTFGLSEMFRSFSISAQMKELQRYVPAITANDVERGPAGVRAQAMSPDGKLVDDFVFDSGSGELGKLVMHVRNAPSPGATSSLAIAKMVADETAKRFQL